VLPTLADASVHCVVTSPPYYGLRDYGTALWDGGDAACQHSVARISERSRVQHDVYAPPSGWTNRDATPPRVCSCGARRIDAQIGLEPTPDAYLAAMVAVFREVRRVLRDDGTCWVNMGDSYASGEVGRHDHKQAAGICVGDAAAGRSFIGNGMGAREQRALSTGLPAKNLLLMPARLALALQADGWWVRSDIIWAKPNPMPESCRDRPTSAHEHVFLLTKRSRYYYDSDAVREEAINEGRVVSYDGTQKNTGHENRTYPGAKPRDIVVSGRNLRNVWTIATAPYAEAHFATFQPLLAESCIRAGTSERGCCAACGAPWVREIASDSAANSRNERIADYDVGGLAKGSSADRVRRLDGKNYEHVRRVTGGWAASCACGAETQPCVVLDCFSGAGTTALVADRLGRHAIGIDLSHQYVEMSRARLEADCPLFTSWAPAEDPEEARMRDLFQDMAAD
jgi:DNA modification methylase